MTIKWDIIEAENKKKKENKQIETIKQELNADELILQTSKELILRELAKRSFRHFVEYMDPNFKFSKFNLELMQILQDAYDWKINRIVVNMPPRHGKTMLISQFFPAWALWRNPKEEVINVWYTVELAKKSLARSIWLMKRKRFENVFWKPNFWVQSATLTETFAHKSWKPGWYKAAWVGWWITGTWMSIGIVDDIVKNGQEAASATIQEKVIEWYWSTFRTRMTGNEQRDVDNVIIIIVMTRRNVNDLVWYLVEKEKEGWDKFLKFIYPAVNEEWEYLFPEMFSMWYYEWFRNALEPQQREAEYMQNPIKAMGNIFKKEYFKYFYRSDFTDVNAILKKQDFIWWVHIDPAQSTNKNSDDTAIMLVWQHKLTKDFYVWDVDWWTISPTVAYSKIFNMISLWEGEWLQIQYISIEQVAINKNQTLFKQNLLLKMKELDKSYTILDYLPKENKTDRVLWTLEWKFQQWRIYFLNSSDSGWNKLFKTTEDELLRFPMMKHDDFPDVLAQAVQQLPMRLINLWYTPMQEQKYQVVNPQTYEVTRE